MNAFQAVSLLLMIVLAACRTSTERAVDAAREKAASCLRHEAQENGLEARDLEAAAAATMEACSEELSAERSAYRLSWQDYEDDVVRAGVAKIREARLQQARSFIAVERVR
jgi:hypothetical protein